MQRISSTSISSATLDESPIAYKPKDKIVSLNSPAVDIVNIIKPIYSLKVG